MAYQIQRRAKSDPLDLIMKGLNIAQSVYGIKSQHDKNVQSELEQDRVKEGILTQKEKLDKLGDFDVVDPKTDGAQTFKAQKGDTVEEFGLIPRKKTLNPYEAENQRLQNENLRLEGSTKRAGIAEKLTEKNSEATKFKALPIEAQEQIKDLSKKTASKTDIKNSIDSALGQLRDVQVPEEQKIALGLNLLKTLNSTEGQDAVGEGEAKRLASFLEFKLGNFTAPGSFVGRDVDKFIDQVALKSDAIRSAIELNSEKIDRLYGRDQRTVGISIPSQYKPGDKKTAMGGGFISEANASGAEKPTAEDFNAHKWAKSNPKDPRAAEILQRTAVKGLK